MSALLKLLKFYLISAKHFNLIFKKIKCLSLPPLNSQLIPGINCDFKNISKYSYCFRLCLRFSHNNEVVDISNNSFSC